MIGDHILSLFTVGIFLYAIALIIGLAIFNYFFGFKIAFKRVKNIARLEAFSLRRTLIYKGGSVFLVSALSQGNEIQLYGSKSRKRANKLLKELTARYKVPVLFDSSIKQQSLDYNFGNEPIEYLIGTVAFGLGMIWLGFSVIKAKDGGWGYVIMFAAPTLYCFVNYICSRRAAFLIASSKPPLDSPSKQIQSQPTVERQKTSAEV